MLLQPNTIIDLQTVYILSKCVNKVKDVVQLHLGQTVQSKVTSPIMFNKTT